jgi:hypothetical protein
MSQQRGRMLSIVSAAGVVARSVAVELDCPAERVIEGTAMSQRLALQRYRNVSLAMTFPTNGEQP